MSLYNCQNAKEDAYWEELDRKTEALEMLRCELSTYIENALEEGDLPTVEEFLDNYSHYHPDAHDEIERHFDEALKGFQGTMEVQAG